MAIDDKGVRSRRALLGVGLGAIAATVASALGRAVPVSAANGDTVTIGATSAATLPTTLRLTSNSELNHWAFAGETIGPGPGVWGSSPSGIGVQGTSNTGDGMFARSHHGYGLRATSDDNYAIWGSSDENYGVYGTSDTSYAVVGLSNSSIGVVGLSGTGGGVFGSSGGSAPGVEGRSVEGRGGLFGGKKAQIRLEPSTAATHPASGSAGDIFLDKSKRPWLCKGGSIWVRLDT